MTKTTGNFTDFVSFSRASGGTYLDSDGLIKTAATNVPRVEYDASGNRKGLLIEEARTNLFTNSNQYSAGGPGAGSISLTTAATGLVGSSTYVNIGTVNGAFLQASNTVSISGSITTMTIFVKKGLYSRYLALRMQGTYPSRLDVTYDLDSGVVSATSGNTYTHVASSIIPIGDGWFRVSATVNPVGSNLNTCYVSFVENSTGQIDQTQPAFPRDGYIAGAQLEVGAFPTSYIPTSGATATRAADICSIATSAFGYNQGAGTIVVDVDNPITNRVGNRKYIWNINDAGFDRLSVRASDSDPVIEPVAVVGDGTSNLNLTISHTTGDQYVVALAYNKSGSGFCADGVLSLITKGYAGSTRTLLAVGHSGSGSGQITGHIKSIAYYPRRLSNAQLVALTS